MIIQLQDKDETGKRRLLAQHEYDEESFVFEEFANWAREIFQVHEAREPRVVLENSRYFLTERAE